MNTETEQFDEDGEYPEDPPCPTCGGAGKVTTLDYESYFGAMYKPCPECGEDPCIGEPQLS